MMAQRNLLKLLVVALVALSLTGCAGFGRKLKSIMGGGGEAEESVPRQSKVARFSENQNVGVSNTTRNYQRMTKEKFEKEARINENTGSLWVMEGQGSYLFSSNTLRLVGEIVNVKLEGNPKQQLNTKVSVIKNLLAKLEKPKVRKPAAVAGAPGAAPAAGAPADANKPGEGEPGAAQTADNKDEKKDKDDKDLSDFQVDLVPARIVDRTIEGHYRIKGTQTFMIGKREYKVIVTGMVRPADVNGDEVDSSKILEPKFDVVSLKKELKL